jgi:hypothetical protein
MEIRFMAMQTTKTTPTARLGTTEELASFLRLKQESIRVQLCRKGSYFGLTPVRAPNGRLLWDMDAAEQLLRGRG